MPTETGKDNRSLSHTPGPWRIDADQQAETKTREICERYGIRESRGTAILGDIKQWESNESYSTVAVINDDNWECAANARLIAAAPELLACLKEALELIQEDIDNRDGRDNFGMCCGRCDGAIPVKHSFGCRAKAAISKAETGQ